MGIINGGRHLHIEYRTVEEQIPTKGSCIYAAFTTAYARVHLYDIIDRFSQYVAYTDTDSVILYLPPGEDGPETSNLLGGLKDEILEDDKLGPGHSISFFVCGGPKCYSYAVVRDETQEVVQTVCKFKGIRPSARNEHLLTAEAMKDIVVHRNAFFVPQFQIARDLRRLRLFTRHYDKIAQFTSCKRQFIEDDPTLSTLPYGYH